MSYDDPNIFKVGFTVDVGGLGDEGRAYWLKPARGTPRLYRTIKALAKTIASDAEKWGKYVESTYGTTSYHNGTMCPRFCPHCGERYMGDVRETVTGATYYCIHCGLNHFAAKGDV